MARRQRARPAPRVDLANREQVAACRRALRSLEKSARQLDLAARGDPEGDAYVRMVLAFAEALIEEHARDGRRIAELETRLQAAEVERAQAQVTAGVVGVLWLTALQGEPVAPANSS